MSIPRLFPPPPLSLTEGLEGFAQLLQRVLPIRPKHRAALPAQIRTLSGYLTVEREQLPCDYMNQPPLLSAYLHYFLPWNIYRQGRLLAGLDLRVKPGARILDLGAGPLTFLLALWLARPGMRDQELQYLGVDQSEMVLKHGRGLFRELAGGSSWSVRTERKTAVAVRTAPSDLLVMANLLNEMEWGGGRSAASGADEGQESPYEKALLKWGRMVGADGAILLIEPGTRSSARQLVRLREVALKLGWRVAAPCPHELSCPMPGQRHTAWCHFNFPAVGAPFWLQKLSRRAKLPKDRASLSFLLLTRGDDPVVRVGTGQPPVAGETAVRAVSEAFDLPDWQRGSYGCAEPGLVLLQDQKGGGGAQPSPGDLIRVVWPSMPERDRKSGAWIIPRSR